MSLTVKRVISWALVIAWMAAIYMLSAQPVEKSAQTSQPVALFVARVMGEPLEAMPKNEYQQTLDRYQHIVRKAAHITEYAILAALLFIALGLMPVSLRARLIFSALPAILYGVADELHQLWVSGRGAGVGDMLFDALGAITGTALCLAFIMLRQRKRRNQN